MKSLESEGSPFRKRPEFYKPHHPRKISYPRRNFANLHSTANNPIILSNEKEEGRFDAECATNNEHNKVRDYVGQIQKVKFISRGFIRQDLYYPDPEKNMKKVPNMYATSRSKRSSSIMLPLPTSYHKTIETQRENLGRTTRAKSDKKSEINLTFYNTKYKSNFFMKKFENDEFLEQRSTPVFQNMLHRTVVVNDILDKAKKKNERKFVHGF